jgi:hypothetical protein
MEIELPAAMLLLTESELPKRRIEHNFGKRTTHSRE